MGRSEWLSLISWWAWLWCHQISAREVTVICPGGFGIGYRGRALAGSSSLDIAPVTGSLLFNTPVCRLAVYCATGFSSCVLFGGCDSIWLAVFGLFFQLVSVDFVMATDGDATAGARSGITFGVTLDVPWNAPEAIVHLHSDGVVDLDTVPDVLSLTGRQPEAAVIRVLQGPREHDADIAVGVAVLNVIWHLRLRAVRFHRIMLSPGCSVLPRHALLGGMSGVYAP